MDTVVGIDLSGLSSGTKGRTVAAHLSIEHPRRLIEAPFVVPRGQRGDVQLIDWIEARSPRVVAVDAPLTLPHSVGCRRADCPRCQPGHANYLERDVDAIARAEGGGMPFVMLAAIAFRGMYLARMLARPGLHVIEVYPAGAYRRLGLKEGGVEARIELLDRYVTGLEWRPEALGDQVDAVCAALVAADFAEGPHQGAFTGQDGAIWLSRSTHA